MNKKFTAVYTPPASKNVAIVNPDNTLTHLTVTESVTLTDDKKTPPEVQEILRKIFENS